jgi:sugar phosphate isomerase/epimerase
MKRPLLILSSRASFNRYRESIRYAKGNDYQGIEWYLDYFRLPVWRGLRDKFFNTLRKSGLQYSFHAPTADVELALKDRIHSTVALDYLKMYIDFLAELAPVKFTIHLGARRIPVEDLSWEHALDHLKRLTNYGYSKKVTVCLENLVGGWTGHPETLMELVASSGAGITFDIGHVRGGKWVRESHGTPLDFLNIIAPKVLNVHVYEYENERGEHLAPGQDTRIFPLLEKLVAMGCPWWVLELNTSQEAEETRRVVEDYLNGLVEKRSGDGVPTSA